ncbi:amidohydrolase [Sulfitobacter pacificus]|uniref:amidohydrolase n=1 Tax=Sulfitobacter pacificus TaxID=1499314 RepID=UPI00310C10D0
MADIVIQNGRLITFNGPDQQALAITDGLITAVGSDADMAPHLAGAEVIDAEGATVLPGFIDSHVHLFQGAVEATWVKLFGIRSKDKIAEAVRARSKAQPEDKIIFAIGMSHGCMDGAEPDRHHMDDILRDRPFAAMHAGHHTVWANTKALEAAGILDGADVPDGCEVVMGEDGKATGVLNEVGAFGPVLRLTASGARELAGYETGSNPVPPPSAAEREADKTLIELSLKQIASKGITGLHNMDGNFYQLELLAALEAEGRLTARTEVPMHFKNFDSIDRLSEAADMRSQYSGDMVWSNRVKMFMDGVIESRTAVMTRPYTDTGTLADPLFSQPFFDEVCTKADAMDLQIAVHSIGDGAVHRVLNGYEAARRANGPRDSRHRIEHIEVLLPSDLPRFAELGVVASIQPPHGPGGGYFDFGDAEDSILRAEELGWNYPMRRLLEAGAKVILNTDWPVVPIDVLPSIHAAVVGKDLPAPWVDDRLTLRQALAAYTRDNAWVEFNESRKGRLSAGMMGDVVILDRDIEAAPLSQLNQAKVRATLLGGRIIYDRTSQNADFG